MADSVPQTASPTVEAAVTAEYPRVSIDNEYDALYIYLDGRDVHRTEEYANGRVMIDFAQDGTVIGIEVLGDG